MLCRQYLFKVIRKSTIMYMRQFVAAAESVRQHCCEVLVLVPPALNPLGLRHGPGLNPPADNGKGLMISCTYPLHQYQPQLSLCPRHFCQLRREESIKTQLLGELEITNQNS